MNKNKFVKKTKLKKILYFYRVLTIILLICIGVASYGYFTKETVIVVNKEIMNPNVLMLGDSITEIYDLNEFYGEDKLIVNSGISGNKTEDILNNLKSRVYNYNPSKVFLLIGINDILFDGKNGEYVYDKMIEIINHIHEKLPNTTIYIESLYPYNDDFENHFNGEIPNYEFVSTNIDYVNERLEQYANEKKYTKYIDLNSELSDESGKFDLRFSYDGLHPNEEGYKLITSILKKYM